MTVTIFDRLEKPIYGSRFLISPLALKAGSSVACAFEGLDNVYLEAFRQILRQNYSEAE